MRNSGTFHMEYCNIHIKGLYWFLCTCYHWDISFATPIFPFMVTEITVLSLFQTQGSWHAGSSTQVPRWYYTLDDPSFFSVIYTGQGSWLSAHNTTHQTNTAIPSPLTLNLPLRIWVLFLTLAQVGSRTRRNCFINSSINLEIFQELEQFSGTGRINAILSWELDHQQQKVFPLLKNMKCHGRTLSNSLQPIKCHCIKKCP